MSPVRAREAAPQLRYAYLFLRHEWYNSRCMQKCLYCREILGSRWQKKYCSNRCQFDFQYAQFISLWKEGNLSKARLNTINISQHLRKYLFKKHGEKCSVCGWNQQHPISGVIPLEVDHIDGNAENNLESNLRLLCPNCHALTPNFKNRHKGNGRSWRRKVHARKASGIA